MHLARISIAASVLALLTFFAMPQAFACECTAPAWKDRTVSYEMGKAETVITGIVLSEPDPETQQEQRSIKVRVEKVYKGKVKAGEVLTIGQAGGKDCQWYFSKTNVGQTYLFYLTKPTKTLPYKTTDEIERSNAEPKYYVSTCGRSADIEKAAEDIAYLNHLPRESRLDF